VTGTRIHEARNRLALGTRDRGKPGCTRYRC
jgi:hypothetical protein